MGKGLIIFRPKQVRKMWLVEGEKVTYVCLKMKIMNKFMWFVIRNFEKSKN